MLVITVVTFPGGHTEFSLWCQSKTSEGVFSPEHLFNRVSREWVEVGVRTQWKKHQSMCTIPVNGHFKHSNHQEPSRDLGIGTSPVFQVVSLCTISVKTLSQAFHHFRNRPAHSCHIQLFVFSMWLLCHE